MGGEVKRRGAGLVLLLTVLAAWPAYEHVAIRRPVSSTLAEDPRNAGMTFRAGFGGLSTGVLVLNLREATAAAPVDLLRALFQTAEIFAGRREFREVRLARSGQVVFVLRGGDFEEIGREFGAGQNPMYLMRTLPGKLYLPDGSPAFGQWSGGMLGVLLREMEDVNAAANRWAAGR
jgi:hypothetical protein